MSTKNKDISAEELKRIYLQAAKKYPLWQDHKYDNRGYSGYCRGAKAEYLRHLSGKAAIETEIRRSTIDGLYQSILASGQPFPGELRDIFHKVMNSLPTSPSSKPEIGPRWVKALNRQPSHENLVFFFKVVFEDGTTHMRHGKYRMIEDLGGCFDAYNGCYRIEEFGKYIIWLDESIPSSESAKESQPDEQWNRESARAAAKEAYKSFAGLPSEFDDWFDSEYPPSLQPEPSEEKEEIKKLRGLLLEYGVRAGVFLPTEEWLIDLFDIGFKDCWGLFAHANEILYDNSKDIQEQTRPHIPPEYKLDEGDEFIEKHLKNIKSLRAEYAEKFPLPPSPPSVKPDEMRSLTDKEAEVLGKTLYRTAKKERSIKPISEIDSMIRRHTEQLIAEGPDACRKFLKDAGILTEEETGQASVKPKREDAAVSIGYYSVEQLCEKCGEKYFGRCICEPPPVLTTTSTGGDVTYANLANSSSPAVQQEDGEVPQFTSIWDASKAFEKVAEKYYENIPISPNALLEKNHNVVRRAAAEWGATWMRKALEQELKDQKAKQKDLQSQLSALRAELDERLKLQIQQEAQLATLRQEKEDYRQALDRIWRDPNKHPSVGKYCSEILSKYTPQNPTNA